VQLVLETAKRLAGWVDAIEYRVFCFLVGAVPESDEGL